MVIDKTDELYRYLAKLGVDDIDKAYIEFASLGRCTRADVQAYLMSKLEPSVIDEIDEKELEKVLDYFIDLKSMKVIKTKDMSKALKDYKNTNDPELRELIINSNLRDVLMICLNYKSLHKDVDIQDLVQIANIGLLTALDKYQPDSRIAFMDYIVYYLNEQISEEFEEKKNG